MNWASAKLKHPKVVDGAAVGNAAVVDGGAEFSVVYDDGAFASNPAERLKMLWGNASVSSSGNGEDWVPFGRWTNTSIDPGISLYRNPLDTEELVVTARPQALRRADGRHAGYHVGRSWAELASKPNTQVTRLTVLTHCCRHFCGLACARPFQMFEFHPSSTVR